MNIHIYIIRSRQTIFTASIYNTDLEQSKRPGTTPFYQIDINPNEYRFVVNTAPIFCNLPNPCNFLIPTMSLEKLKTTSKSLILKKCI